MPAHSHHSIFRYILYLQDSADDIPDIQSARSPYSWAKGYIGFPGFGDKQQDRIVAFRSRQAWTSRIGHG